MLRGTIHHSRFDWVRCGTRGCSPRLVSRPTKGPLVVRPRRLLASTGPDERTNHSAAIHPWVALPLQLPESRYTHVRASFHHDVCARGAFGSLPGWGLKFKTDLVTCVLTSLTRSYSAASSKSSSSSSSSSSPHDPTNVLGFRTLIKCQPGLENVLMQELTSLGIVGPTSLHPQRLLRHNPGQVDLPHVTVHDLHVCQLYLGSASQIWIQCGPPVTVRALGELQRKVQNAANQWIHCLLLRNDGEALLPHVKAQARKSRIIHTGAIQERVLEAVRAALAEPTKHSRPGRPKMVASNRSSDNKDNKDDDDGIATLHVSVVRDVVTLWLDTSSSSSKAGPLHRRGYRLETAKAPLREDLSYALLYSAGWKPWLLPKGKHSTSDCSGDEDSNDSLARTGTLLDPFCGSGTIVLEAAAIALGLPPGRLRPPPLQGTALHDPQLWQTLVSRATEHSRRRCTRATDGADAAVRVFGSDRDEGAVAVARANALRTGLQEFVEFRACAVSSHPQLQKQLPRATHSSSPLLVATNVSPESGVLSPGSNSSRSRRHNVPHLLPLFQKLAVRAAAAAAHPSCTSVVLLTNNASLVERAFPPPSWNCDKVLETSHGGIRVTAVHCTGNGTPAVEAEDGTDDQLPSVATL